MIQSAGLLLYRFRQEILEVFLVHPGGPFWKNKDLGSWSIPKGEYAAPEDALQAALREFKEETGFEPDGDFMPLETIKLKSGKKVSAWAVAGDCDPEKIQSNTFEMEWPPKSGRLQQFPEIDRGGWFAIGPALEKVNVAQQSFLQELAEKLQKR